MVTEYDKGGGPDTLKAWLTNDKGKVYEVRGEVLRTAKLPYAGVLVRNVPIMYEALAKFTHRESVGYGIAESLIRLK